MPTPQPERRRAPRALADFSIQLAPPSGASAARLKDISEIGLACLSPARLEEMALVAIDLALPGQATTHRLQGAVVRCDPVRGQKGQFEVAVYFTQIGAEAKAALRNYVKKGKPAP